MTESAKLIATPRLKAGKGPANQAREQGFLPAVVYGDKKTPDLINVDPKIFFQEMHKPGFSGRIFTLEMEGGKTQKALPKAVQLHPVSDRPLHVDFLRVSAKTVVNVNIPIKFINEDLSPGLKSGGVLNIVHHDVELVCKADSIPEALEINLEGTNVGHSFHLDSIELPAGAKPATSDAAGYTIATLLAPRVESEVEDTPAEAAEGAEDAEKSEESEK